MTRENNSFQQLQASYFATLEWENNKGRREETARRILTSIIDRGLENPDFDWDFLLQKTPEIMALSRLPSSDIENANFSEVDLAAITSRNAYDYADANGNIVEHTQKTLVTANFIARSMVPDDNLAVTESMESILKKAHAKENLDLARIIKNNRGMVIEFSTLINGIVLSYSLVTKKAIPRLVEIKPLLKQDPLLLQLEDARTKI